MRGTHPKLALGMQENNARDEGLSRCHLRPKHRKHLRPKLQLGTPIKTNRKLQEVMGVLKKLTSAVAATLTAALLLLASPCPAQMELGGTEESIAPTDYFYDGTSARSFGMGGAQLAVGGDLDSVYWNPAGLSLIDSTRFRSTHSKLSILDPLEISTQNFSFAMPIGAIGVGGFSYVYSSLGETPIYTIDEETSRLEYSHSIESEENSFALSYGRPSGENTSIGLTVKYARLVMGPERASGWGFDLGMMYDYSENIRLGVSVQNLGDMQIGTDEIPANFRIGLAGNFLENRLLLATSFESSHLEEEIMSVGAEYMLAGGLAARAGSRGGDFSAGLGYAFDRYRIDYAFHNDDVVGDQQKLTVEYVMPVKPRPGPPVPAKVEEVKTDKKKEPASRDKDKKEDKEKKSKKEKEKKADKEEKKDKEKTEKKKRDKKTDKEQEKKKDSEKEADKKEITEKEAEQLEVPASPFVPVLETNPTPLPALGDILGDESEQGTQDPTADWSSSGEGTYNVAQ